MAEANQSGTEASATSRKRTKARRSGGSKSKAVAKKSGGSSAGSKSKKAGTKITAKKVALGVGAVALTAAAGYAVTRLLKNRKAKKRTNGSSTTGA